MHAANAYYMEFSASEYSVNISQKPSDQLEESQGNSASDTTDDEQEDLPYDGILEYYLVPSLDHNQENKSSIHSDSHQALISLEDSQHNKSPIESETANDEAFYSVDGSDVFSLSETVSNTTEANENTGHESEKLITNPTIISDVLLRHFTDDDLLNPFEFIDYETMPEISIAESTDETVISRKICSNQRQYDLSKGQEENFGEEYLEVYQIENSDIQEMNNEINFDTNEISPTGDAKGNGPELIQESMGLNELLPDNVDEKSQYPKYDTERRPSYDIKYGQGQVHYKLPDFSKVPPKVKIPKGENGGVKPVSTIKRAASSPNIMGQSFAIRDILDSMQPFMQQEQIKESNLSSDLLHEQVSEASIYISDFNNKVESMCPPASECLTSDFCQSLNHIENQAEVLLLGLHAEDALQTSESAPVINEIKNLDIAQIPTEGDMMSKLLMEQAQKLKTKVESFSDCLFKKSLPRKEELLVFQNLRSCVESLELNYLSAKDKHRDLQLQIYRTGSQTVGEFDLEREVEGQIFRLGMLLEDIQEQINRREESLTESASPTTPCEAPLLPDTEVTEGVTDLAINNITEKVVTSQDQETVSLLPCSRSLNRTAAPETQIPLQDSPLVKEATDIPHLLLSYLSSDTCTEIRNSETSTQTDAELGDLNITDSSVQLAGRDASVISKDCPPHQNGQNHLSMRECYTDWHLAENSVHLEEKEIAEKIKKDIEWYPLYPNRCQEDEVGKTQRKFSKPGKLSILIQQKAVNLDYPDCNETEDSSSSDWLVSSHSGLSQYRNQGPRNDRTNLSKGQSYNSSEKYIQLEDYNDFALSCILNRHSITTSSSSPRWEKYSSGRLSTGSSSKLLNPDTSMKELQKQRSFWASKIPVYAENQSDLSNLLHVNKHRKVSQYTPSSRSNVHALVSRHSQFVDSVVPTLQRKSWLCVKRNSLDYSDSKILNSVLDQALRTAKDMQKTTARMVQKMTADLVNRPSYRSSYSF